MPVDPVCGMPVEKDSAVATAVHEGVTYYFCCKGCKESFEQDPQRYGARAQEDEC